MFSNFTELYSFPLPQLHVFPDFVDPVAVADAIERLLNDKNLYNHIVSYQKQEKKGNTEEIEKFYQLIDN